MKEKDDRKDFGTIKSMKYFYWHGEELGRLSNHTPTVTVDNMTR